jgi:hypothetical protein
VMDAMTRRLVRAVESNLAKPLKTPGQSRTRQLGSASTGGPKQARSKRRARARHAK